jgi:hypothetical protein
MVEVIFLKQIKTGMTDKVCVEKSIIKDAVRYVRHAQSSPLQGIRFAEFFSPQFSVG